MFRWIPYAMVRITLFFIAGILAGLYWPDVISESGALIIFACLLLGYFLTVLFLRESSALKTVSGLIGLLALFVAGYAHLLSSTDARKPSHISHFKRPIDFYLGEVTGAPEEKINSVRIEIEIKKIKCNLAWETATGKTLPFQREEASSVRWTGKRIQKVFRVCSSQERFFVRLGRNLSYQRSGMGAHYAAHPLHKRWSELAVSCLRLLVSVRIKIAF